MKKYITTPIYYLNGDPHAGHAYTTAMCDIMRRAFIAQGDDVFFTSGSDEHGQKMQEAAQNAGMSFADFLDMQSAKFLRLTAALNASPDFFIRTSMPQHEKIVQEWLADAFAKGLIVRKKYTGLYCVGCEQFKTDADLDERGFCRDHQRAPVQMDEENYFLPLEPHREWLREFIEQNPDWIQPENYRNEVIAMLKEPLPDLSISRPKTRVALGIELPFDSEHVVYVWYDALINYISSLRMNDKMDYWGAGAAHVLGKDILKPHCIYWPVMLRVAGLSPVARNLLHAHWTGEGGVKMSKSLGNVVDPFAVIDEMGADSLRFYFAHNAPVARDASISHDLLRHGYEALANNFGNLYLRTWKMIEKYADKKIPTNALSADNAAVLDGVRKALEIRIENLTDIQKLAAEILRQSSELNSYIDRTQPWAIAKDPARADELMQVLQVLAGGVIALANAAAPIMPAAADKILSSFGAGSGNLTESVVLFPKLD